MRSWFALFLVCCFFSGSAQLPADIKFTSYNRNNGLPEEFVNCTTQDSRGFLWIGSREGLIRFDGHTYQTWYANPGDHSNFSNNNIFVVSEYVPGYLLFTSGAEIWRINIYNLQIQRISRYAGKSIVSKPVNIDKGRWLLADADSLYLTNEELVPVLTLAVGQYFPAKTIVTGFPLQYPYLLLMAGMASPSYILNYQTNEITPLTFETRLLDSRAKFFVPQAYDSNQRRLYLSAYFNGSFYCDLQWPLIQQYHPVPIPALPDGAIRKSLLLPGGLIMQGGDFGLYISDLRHKITFSTDAGAENPLAHKVILDICRGKNDLYWLSTTGGIVRFTLKEPAVNYTTKKIYTAPDDEFKRILKGGDRRLYFLLQERSLFRFDKGQGSAKRLDSALTYCWSAMTDGNDIIATGANKKIIRYNTQTGQISYPRFLEPFYTTTTDVVTLAYKAANGDRWFSCNGGAGLIRNPAGSSQFIQYSKHSFPQRITLSYVHTAAEDSHGNIWWGSNKSQVLLQWNALQQKFEEYMVNRLIPQFTLSAGINNLFVDTEDNLWISLDGAGLLKYNIATKNGSYYDISHHLPANAVFSMVCDASGRIWFTTRKGLCCYLPGKDKIVTFTSYDGFPESNFEGNGIYYDHEENLLYTGVMGSLAWFNPDTLLKSGITQQPAVYIDQMLVNGKKFYFSNPGNIRLKTTENNLEFGIASPDFFRNGQLIFQYLLKGAAGEWTDLNDKRTVTFNNLAHGTYTLSVRCKYKGAETWSETTLPFTFTIQTPWHQTWWFRLGLGMIMLFFTWFMIRIYYRRKMEKQQAIMEKEIAIEQERTKMARELHDGLGSMLSGIKHSFAAMSREFELTEKQQLLFHANLDKLNGTIRELRNISHNMASDALLKYGIENSIRDYCSNISSASGIPITCTAINTDNLKLNEEKSFHLFRVMQELLQNIIRHSKASQVIVQLSYHNEVLHITVEDDGTGFDMEEAKKQKSMGLKNIEARVKLIRGQLDYQTAPGKGTSVMITLHGG